MQEEVLLLLNMLSNKFNDFVNTFNKQNIISRHQTRNAMSPLRPGTENNKVVGNSQIQKKLQKNRVISYSKMKKRAIGKNGIAKYFKREKEMENTNGDISEVSFFNQRIIKYN